MNVTERHCIKSLVMIVGWFLLFLLDQLDVNIDWILIFGVTVAICYCAYREPNFIIRYIMVFFMAVGNLAGVFICEHSNLWLNELGVYSGYVGSFPLICAGWTIFISTVWLLDQKYPFSDEAKKNEIIKFRMGQRTILVQEGVVILSFVLSALLLLHVIPHPAFAEHMDRFAYQAQYMSAIWRHIATTVYTGLPILIAIFILKGTDSKFVKILGHLGLWMYIGFLFCSGEKFGGFWYIVVLFCIIFSIKGQNMSVRCLRSSLLKVVAIFFLLLMILLVHRSLTYDSAMASTYLPQRIAQQGQLWWATYKLDKNNNLHVDELDDEFGTYFQFSDINDKEYNHAIYKIMRVVTPSNLFQRKIESGSRYSTSTFASMFYYFKIPGVFIFAVIGGLLYWGIMREFIRNIHHGNIVEILLLNKFLSIYYGIIAMSELNIALQYKQLFYLSIYIFMVIFREYFYRKQRD